MAGLPKTMRAIVCATPGPISVLKMQNFPVPVPEPGQVLIKILGFGINRAEMYTRQGHSSIEFPRIIGIECIGVVAGYPRSNTSPPVPVGSRVATCMGGMGREIHGSYAEYTCVAQENIQPIPATKNLSVTQLASFPEMLQTTWGSLNAGLDVNEGESVLVRGATSSIGLCAIQLLRLKGASRIAATSRSKDRESMLRDAGADEVFIDTGSIAEQVSQTPGGKFDKVLELVGTTTLRDSLRCLKDGGTCCMSGIQGGEWKIDGFEPIIDLYNKKRLSAYGGGPADFLSMPWQDLVIDADEGRLNIPIRAFKFEEEDLHKIHEIMESGGGGAKMVVVVAEE